MFFWKSANLIGSPVFLFVCCFFLVFFLFFLFANKARACGRSSKIKKVPFAFGLIMYKIVGVDLQSLKVSSKTIRSLALIF